MTQWVDWCYGYGSVAVSAKSIPVTEELLSMNMNSLWETITGKNIFKKMLHQYILKWNLLRCITTDDGKNLCGSEKGSVHKWTKIVKKYLKPMAVNCLIYEQSLCRKYLNLLCVVGT